MKKHAYKILALLLFLVSFAVAAGCFEAFNAGGESLGNYSTLEECRTVAGPLGTCVETLL